MWVDLRFWISDLRAPFAQVVVAEDELFGCRVLTSVVIYRLGSATYVTRVYIQGQYGVEWRESSRRRLAIEAHAEIVRLIRQRHDPLAGWHEIADAIKETA